MGYFSVVREIFSCIMQHLLVGACKIFLVTECGIFIAACGIISVVIHVIFIVVCGICVAA